MIRKILIGMVMVMAFQSSLQASTLPTKAEITKLYVASFNRAPDAGGLQYWVDEGLTLKEIARYFFDSTEMQETYPPNSTTEDFVEAVYLNLFNRADDPEGVAYWANEIDLGHITRAELILFAIDTDSDSDAAILDNKTTVGLAFAAAGLSDTENARIIMSGVTDDVSTVSAALENIENTEYIYDEKGRLISYVAVYSFYSKEGSITYYSNGNIKTDIWTKHFSNGAWYKSTSYYAEELNYRITSSEQESSYGSYGDESWTYYSNGNVKVYVWTYHHSDDSWNKFTTYYDEENSHRITISEEEGSDGSYGDSTYTYYSNGNLKTIIFTQHYFDDSWTKYTNYYAEENNYGQTRLDWESSDGSYGDNTYTYYSNGKRKTHIRTSYSSDGSWTKYTYYYDEDGNLVDEEHEEG